MKKNGFKVAIWYVAMIAIVIVAIALLYGDGAKGKEIKYSDIIGYFKDGKVQSYDVNYDDSTVSLEILEADKDGKETYAITTLNLSDNKITDISSLEKVTSLTTLDLSKNDITDITAIGKLTTLKTLDLTNNAGLASLKPIVENFPATSTLTLNIIGTKIASDTDAIKTIQDKFSTMKITYMLDKESK